MHGTPKDKAPPPLSLYIHLPWCVRKCPYCDFNSHPLREDVPETDYIDALLSDLESELPGIWGRRIISIFIGGGTPSLFSGEAITRLIEGVRARLTLLPGCEITLEANPGASDAQRFSAYHTAGVNRLSIGIQSFDNDKLKALGRIHNSDDAHAAIDAARTAGFDNINLDLMFGLPQQTEDQALTDLDTALGYETPHLSLYQLTLEPNTEFAKHPPTVADDDTLWTMQQHLQQQLQVSGYHNYEVSAYAQAQQQCKHNLNYWQFGDYLGIGAGAHSKITSHDRIHRFAKRKHPRDYMQSVAAAECKTGVRILSEQDLRFEFMLNALRLTDSIDTSLFEQHTRLPLAALEPALGQAIDNGWLTHEQQQIQTTETGRRFLNDVIGLFLE